MAESSCTMRVRGRVQGVAYRAHAAAEARRFGLTGTVRNLPDGSVELVATGPRADVERLADWCRRGPPAARVASVELQWHAEPARFGGFSIVG
ncbi:MAG: acylphosphatase [Deltaproteobacteria bacterium]|nr:acylphosphatase [Deltaproteobacteria bacterium]